MRRIAAVVITALVAVSCARTPGRAAGETTARAGALLAAFEVKGDPAALPDSDRVRLEAAAIRIVAAGQPMIPSIIEDMETNRDGARRMALLKLLVMITERIPSGRSSRAHADRQIEAASRKMRASSDASDRYVGIALAGAPTRSGLVEAALGGLGDSDADNRAFANAILVDVSDVDLGFKSDADDASRRAAAKRWNDWWAKNRKRAYFYLPTSNPLYMAIAEEASYTARHAGPYPVHVTDASGAPAAGAVVAYSYYFTTFDGWGDKRQQRTTTDAEGNVLLGAEVAAPGMKFVGAQLIVSKTGYEEFALSISPHILTRNSFAIEVTVEPETK